MKGVYVPILLLCLLVPALATASPEYDTELADLAATFKQNITDLDAIEILSARAEALEDRISEDRRSRKDFLSREEMDRLRLQEDQADAFEDVFEVVGQLDFGDDVSLEEFTLANERLGLEWQVVAALQDGIEIVRIDIGGYRSFLFHNPGPDHYVAKYEFSTSSGDQPGGGMNIPCAALVSILNSRDKDTDGIEFRNVSLNKNIYMESCN